MVPVNVTLQQRGGLGLRIEIDTEELTYTIYSEDILGDESGIKLDSELVGSLSPVSQVTLPPTERAKARIPSDATHFFWAHGISEDSRSGLDGISEEQQKMIAEGHWHFIAFGPFVCERIASLYP